MLKNKNILPVVNFFIVLSLMCGMIVGCSQPETIKLGFAGQLTGIYSDLGVQGRNGVELAVDRLNEEHRPKDFKLELIVKDDKNSVKGALEADKQLIDRGVHAIIGHMTSAQTLGVEQFIKEHYIPLISPTASSPLLKGKKDCIFRLNPSSDRSASVMGELAFNQLEEQRVAVVYDTKNQAYSLLYAKEFVRSFKNLGGETPVQISFSSDQRIGWKHIIDRIESKDITAVAIVASAADTAAFAQKVDERGKSWKIYGSGWAYTQNLIQYGGRAVEGLIFTDSFNSESMEPAFQEFKRQYIERFGREPMFSAAQGYESVLFLVEGLKRRAEYEGDLVKALQSIQKIEGLMGTLRFDEFGDVKRPYFISKVKNGEFQIIDSMMNK